MFEVLKGMQLPDFDIGNWQSKIRHLVKTLPEYSTIDHWPWKETSDIVYKDTKKQLTSYLLAHGYLGEDLWNDVEEGPDYFLEVKTTLRECEHPFYVSKGQYALVSYSCSIITLVTINMLTIIDGGENDGSSCVAHTNLCDLSGVQPRRGRHGHAYLRRSVEHETE